MPAHFVSGGPTLSRQKKRLPRPISILLFPLSLLFRFSTRKAYLQQFDKKLY